MNKLGHPSELRMLTHERGVENIDMEKCPHWKKTECFRKLANQVTTKLRMVIDQLITIN